MKTINHRSFAKFLDHIASKPLNQSIFRGQLNYRWCLENRWIRFRRDFLDPAHSGKNVRDKLRQNAIIRFQSSDFGKEGMTEAEAEALCQHHGLPTRLMDWTYSPYIAAFFAFDCGSVKTPSSAKCAIFEIDLKKFVYASCYNVENDEALARSYDANKYAYTEDVNVENPRILSVNDRSNRRMQRQEGVFLIIPDRYNNFEQFETECASKNSECTFLTKHTVPNSSRFQTISHIQSMGHNSARIFCDQSMSAIDATLQTLAELQ